MRYTTDMNEFIRKMSAYKFLDAVKLVGVIFVLLFSHNGLNPFQISILISIWSVTQLLLEVPLGIVETHLKNILAVRNTLEEEKR